MSDETLQDLHRRHQEAQLKYVYFLLAVSASAIAFSAQKTDHLIFSWSLAPLGIAVLLWLGSFYFGCAQLMRLQAALRANFGLLQYLRGVHPEQPEDPEYADAAISGVTEALNENIDRAALYAALQFWLLIAGAVLFVIWHIIEMWLRTNAS